jgi:signal transduction histidine kinase
MRSHFPIRERRRAPRPEPLGRGAASSCPGSRSGVCALPAVLACLAVIGGTPAGAAEHAQFLVIHSAHSTLAASAEVGAGIRAVFDKQLQAGYEIFAEYRDEQRFPGAEEDAAFAEELVRKYRDATFDAILVFGPPALAFVLEYRQTLGQGVPLVFGGVSPDALAGPDLPPGVHGVVNSFSLSGTLALARRLQPEAHRVVVMTGSSDFDRSWNETARRELAGLTDIAVDHVSGLTLEAFEAAAAGLDADTILLILTIFEDAAGRQFTPLNAAEVIAAAAAAPAYSVYDTYVGRGIVGGEVQRFRDIGAAMAEQALLLAGDEPGVQAVREAPLRVIVDWRAMQRFGLDVDRLPPGATVEHYDPSAWERYRLQILLASAVILAQSATIAGLAIQGRRRHSAEREVAARRVELAHMSRVAQIGELSGAVAHELNQPLTSILANAEVGLELAKRDPADIEEIAAILKDIAEDDRRAAAIIVDLRRLMTKGETSLEPLDLNEVVEATVRLARSEFLVRQVSVEARLAGGGLGVRGSVPQLKQVILNLLLNAADAMADQPPGSRRILVATRTREDGWRELQVQDLGPGLAAAVAEDPFRPFATTKPGGLGLGLSICRTIVEAHGGTLGFDGDAREGATVILALPPP